MIEELCRVCSQGRTVFVCGKLSCQKQAAREDSVIEALAGLGWYRLPKLSEVTGIPRNGVSNALTRLQGRAWVESCVIPGLRGGRVTKFRLTKDGVHKLHMPQPSDSTPDSIGADCGVEVEEKVYCHTHLAMTGRHVEILPWFIGHIHKGTGKVECDGLPDGRSGHASPARPLRERAIGPGSR